MLMMAVGLACLELPQERGMCHSEVRVQSPSDNFLITPLCFFYLLLVFLRRV